MAKRKSESLAGTERLMEEVCELENCKQALQRVKANQGSPGVDGMTVEELPVYLKQHELEIGEPLRSGTYQPQPVRRVEIPKPDGSGRRKLGIACVLDRFVQQAVLQVLQKRWGPDVLRTQPRFPTGAQCEASGARGAAVYRRRIPLGGGPRFGKIFQSSKPRPSVSGGGQARGRQANAQVDPSVSGGRSDGGRVGESGA